jgi:hypothetical protein
MTSADREPAKQAVTADELETEETTELPDREAMSLLGTDLLPPFVGTPIPVPSPEFQLLGDSALDTATIKDVLIESDISDIKEVSIEPEPPAPDLLGQ